MAARPSGWHKPSAPGPGGPSCLRNIASADELSNGETIEIRLRCNYGGRGGGPGRTARPHLRGGNEASLAQTTVGIMYIINTYF